MADPRPEINMSRIYVGGGLGAGAIVLVLVVALAAELPAVRALAIAGTLAGVTFGLALIAWRGRIRMR